MRQPRPASASASSTPAPAAGAATETVTRPEPGLARGAWEAPSWALYTLLGVIVVGATLYLLRRIGILKLPSEREKKS